MPAGRRNVPGTTGSAPSGNARRRTYVCQSVQAFAFPRGLGVAAGRTRLGAARVVGIAGVLAYNWWVVVPFVPGLMPSVNGFFSDLEATGRPHAELMSDADLVGGALMLVALAMRGSSAGGGVRREWKWLIVFAVAGVVGGRYPYACAEGLSVSCRQLEWHLQLPVHHYVHVTAGVAEFATVTVAAVLAMRRTRGRAPWRPRRMPASSRCWRSATPCSASSTSPTVSEHWWSRSSSLLSRRWC